MAETPSRIGKYQILGELGHGAMGVVYKAQDPAIRRLVALKILALDIQSDNAARERFYREAQAAGNLDHPNIVTIYEMGQEGNTPFIAMEYVEGISLDEVLARGERWPLNRILETVYQIADGLAFAHQRGVIHRDIKPANIRVRQDGRVKIVDFGIARLSTSEMTRTGTVLGTISYMSPEQLEAKTLDGRSDQFAAGCILYELLTGLRAFSGETLSDIMVQILTRDPAPVHQSLPGCPPAVEGIVSRAMRKNREERYPTASAMAADIAVQLSLLRRPMQDGAIATVAPDTPDSRDYAAIGKTLLAEPLPETARPIETILPQGAQVLSPGSPSEKTSTGRSQAVLGVLAVALVVIGLTLVYWYGFRTPSPISAPTGTVGGATPAAPSTPAAPAGAPTYGSLSVLALPWAEVREIRNSDTGVLVDTRNEVTPALFSLPAGRYQVRLANPNFKGEVSVLAEVRANQRTDISSTMPGFDYRKYVR